MNLRDLRAKHPALFYAQDWFDGEGFMTTPHVIDRPFTWRPPTSVLVEERDLVPAIILAAAFVDTPDLSLWSRFLWTSDVDRFGQRVYVGGVCAENGRRFEIHRHLTLTEKWGYPTWR